MRPVVHMNKISVNMRSDSYKRWHQVNPVLRAGEVACVVLLGRFTVYKVGDGVNKFDDLPYKNNLEQALNDGYIYSEIYSNGSSKEVLFSLNIDKYVLR